MRSRKDVKCPYGNRGPGAVPGSAATGILLRGQHCFEGAALSENDEGPRAEETVEG